MACSERLLLHLLRERSMITNISEEPREYTADEICKKVWEHIHHLVDYWAAVNPEYSKKQCIEGFAHSVMAMFDGCTIGLPGFLIVPNPAEEDSQYHISEGENWFPYPKNADELCDIGGGLRYGVSRKACE